MSTDLVCTEAEPELPAVITPTKTATDYRNESVAQALDAAYAKASTLVLTSEEATALAEDFPDEAFRLGAGGDPNLIYIEHAYLRQRLNSVLGVGASVPIRRREWSESFTYMKDGYENTGVRIYVDLVLLVRGCVVGEAIGDATYYPSNPKTNYSDALESAKSSAFRRCCKEFGVGLQAWMKDWGEGWKQRNGGGFRKSAKPAAKKAEYPPPPPQQQFSPPRDWPETAIHDLKSWIETLATSEHYEQALAMFQGEESLVGIVPDWEKVLRHFAETYKSKAGRVATTKLNKSIKAALDKLELDKQADEMLNREAAEAAAE